MYYRVAEKIFCKAFKAEDLSRSDVSADAKKDTLGVGLKTFLEGNKKTFQKVAEFDGDKKLFENLSKENKGSISFNDDIGEYAFLTSKNTLTKRFETENICYEFPIKILENPLDILEDCLGNLRELDFKQNQHNYETIYLPLYGRNHIVNERSGLNQWNARGRKRDYNEVYIPIPAIIHNLYPDFFPARDRIFNLKLPNGKTMQSKVCQDGNKALMSNPNSELGNWILRDVLKLEEGELLTYEKLQILGIDSVRIDKISDFEFEINFSLNGSYDKFININS